MHFTSASSRSLQLGLEITSQSREKTHSTALLATPTGEVYTALLATPTAR